MNNISSPILIDSDVWIGYFLSNDAHHKRAVEGIEQLIKADVEPIVTSAVFGEVLTVLSYKSGQAVARKFCNHVMVSGVMLVHIDKYLTARATEVFVDSQTRGTSYVDCTNVAVIEKLGFSQIYAFDKVYHEEHNIENIAYPDQKVA